MSEDYEEIKTFPNGDKALVIKDNDKRNMLSFTVSNLNQEEINREVVDFFNRNPKIVQYASKYLSQHPEIREQISDDTFDSDSITSTDTRTESEEEDEPKTQKEVQKEPEPKQKLKSKAQKPKVKQIIKNGDHTEINFYFTFN